MLLVNQSQAVLLLRWAHGQPIVAPQAPSRPARTTPPSRALASAHRAYRNGDFAQAKRLYRRALEADPTDPDALQGLAASFVRPGDHAAAVRTYRLAAQVMPNSAPVHVGLGRALLAQGDQQGARVALRRALSLDARNADARRTLASLDAPTRTAVQMRRAPVGRAQAPVDRTQGLRQAARTHFAAQRFDDAIRTYRQLSELNPSDASTHAGLGGSHLAAGDAVASFAAYRRATELAPQDARYRAALGASAEAAGLSDAAEAAYRHALTLDPANRAAQTGLSRLARGSTSTPTVAQAA
ncbi:MAG: tetratricopeptide repeat protein, partial [Verrucomicrobiota bacterium]|nr:tetratricopeptide repeat protein [Verrucomicrobiota bacterium]